MDNASKTILQRIRVGGLKISPELVQFTYSRPVKEPCCLAAALAIIAEQHINISYLTTSTSNQHIHSSFCVETEHHPNVNGIVHSLLENGQQLQCIPSVGTITIFPHRNSFSLPGRILQIFSANNLPIHGLCTSISALSINTSFHFLESAINILTEIVELPDNHAPFRQEFTIRQIGQ